MKALSPAFVELTQDALLKAYWYKPSLRFFLQQHKITESALAKWFPEQSKRDFILWLWPLLLKNEKGNAVILAMARSLSEMRDFPDLERREDTKSRISDAKCAISRLKNAVAEININIQETKDAERRRKQALAEQDRKLAAQETIEKLSNQLNCLMPKLGKSEGGYAFEKWFYELAVFFEMDARPSYKTESGRQIDGAITMDGTTFLIEAKFKNEKVGSPDIDIFMRKIESVADNTMGIFVSISGFNLASIKTASKDRTPMLLLDHSHIFGMILNGYMTLPQLIARVKRHAHQTGQSYLPVAEF